MSRAHALLALLPHLLSLYHFAGAALFTRLRKATILDSEIRESLAIRIRAEPGVTPPELQQATGAGWSTVVYHLRVLERARLVTSIIDGRHKRFFAAGDVDSRDIPRLAALRNERTRQIHALLQVRPGVTQRDVAAAVGIAEPSASWHLRRLERAGLLSRERRGRGIALAAQ